MHLHFLMVSPMPVIYNVSPVMPMDLAKAFPGVDTIQLLAYFFIPGFVSIKVYDLLVPRSQYRDFSKDFYEAFGYSFMNFLVMYAIISNEWLNTQMGSNVILSSILIAILLLCLPALWPFAYLGLAAK